MTQPITTMRLSRNQQLIELTRLLNVVVRFNYDKDVFEIVLSERKIRNGDIIGLGIRFKTFKTIDAFKITEVTYNIGDPDEYHKLFYIFTHYVFDEPFYHKRYYPNFFDNLLTLEGMHELIKTVWEFDPTVNLEQGGWITKHQASNDGYLDSDSSDNQRLVLKNDEGEILTLAGWRKLDKIDDMLPPFYFNNKKQARKFIRDCAIDYIKPQIVNFDNLNLK